VTLLKHGAHDGIGLDAGLRDPPVQVRAAPYCRRMRRFLISLVLVLGLAGCGAAGTTQTPTATPVQGTPVQSSTTVAPSAPKHPAHHRPAHHPAKPPASSGGFPLSRASSTQVQPQPAPGSCHATGTGELVMPDRRCTPGALNPQVTQATIDHTICASGYTKTIRPSSSITGSEKLASMAAYGYGGRSTSDVEYDHLISLELGGAANDPRNLWPETGASPNPKDKVEDTLHRLVCDGQMPLATEQRIIATDWLGWARANGVDTSSTSGSSSQTSAPPAPPSPASSPSSGPNKPIPEVNCSDFPTHAAAQQWFTEHGGSASTNVAGLDGNHDGIACSSLP